VVLNVGKKIPQIGLGTWNSKKGDVGAAIKYAVEHAGYRHIDCASNYLNEDEVGDTLSDLFARGVVKREDLFITSKLNNPYHHKEHVKTNLLKTLKDLNLEYLDLWLMHWPVAFEYVPYDEKIRGFPADYDANTGKLDMTVSIRETWLAMEEVYHQGLVKSIGVSNFTAILIHDLLTYATVKPSVNQVELHPYLQQGQLVSYCEKHNILVEGYSPLGTGEFKKPDEPTVLQDPLLVKLAEKHGKSVAQITLRWFVQRGLVALPKSVTPSRMKENISIFDFSLSEPEMKEIASIDRNYHFLRPQDWYGLPLF